MSLEEKKIKTYADNISDLSDYPSEDGISAEELKAMFDGRGDKEIKNSINGIITELQSNTAASQIGSYEGNIQRELDLKTNKENGEVIGALEVSTWGGEGSVTILPAAVGDRAEIKLSDISGSCAALGMDYDGMLTVSYGNEYINEREKQGRVYTTLSHPNLDLTTAYLEPSQQEKICENLGLNNEISTAKVNVGTASIYKEGEELVLARPMENGVPESCLKIGYDLIFDNMGSNYRVYHSGNLKDLTEIGAALSDYEKEAVLNNIGIAETLGDIDAALSSIISLQEHYIAGGV